MSYGSGTNEDLYFYYCDSCGRRFNRNNIYFSRYNDRLFWFCSVKCQDVYSDEENSNETQ